MILLNIAFTLLTYITTFEQIYLYNYLVIIMLYKLSSSIFKHFKINREVKQLGR